jgi:predicted RNase H-like HicB family nuclease
MKYYYGIVHKDEDSAFGVHFPDLPGCHSAADDQRDIVPNAVAALSLWFEDQPEVAPSSLEHIRDLAGDDIDQGAFVVMVPWIGTPSRPARVNISIDTAVLNAIDRAATDRRLTRSAFIMEAARNEIEGRH